MNLLKRIGRIFTNRIINKVFRFLGFSFLIVLCTFPLNAKAAEIDADAVWENIANINSNIESVQTDLSNLQSQYDSLQSLLDAYAAENQMLSQKVDLTNELLKYLITAYETNAESFFISNEENLKLITESSVTNTSAITGAITANTELLQLIDKRQSEDITNRELSDTLSGHLVDVSGNTLELSNSAKSENNMTGIVVAACILGVTAIAVIVIVKAFSKGIISHIYKI